MKSKLISIRVWEVENAAMLFEGVSLSLFGLFFIALGVWLLRYVEKTEKEMYEVPSLLSGHYYTRDRTQKTAVGWLIAGVIFLLLGIVTLLTQRFLGLFPSP